MSYDTTMEFVTGVCLGAVGGLAFAGAMWAYEKLAARRKEGVRRGRL